MPKTKLDCMPKRLRHYSIHKTFTLPMTIWITQVFLDRNHFLPRNKACSHRSAFSQELMAALKPADVDCQLHLMKICNNMGVYDDIPGFGDFWDKSKSIQVPEISKDVVAKYTVKKIQVHQLQPARSGAASKPKASFCKDHGVAPVGLVPSL